MNEAILMMIVKVGFSFCSGPKVLDNSIGDNDDDDEEFHHFFAFL